MTDSLNKDQNILVRDAIRELNRAQMRLLDGEVKTAARDMIWDLSVLAFDAAYAQDDRTRDEVKEHLRDNGPRVLNDLYKSSARVGKREVRTAKALLKVADLVPDVAPKREAASWQDRVEQNTAQASGRGK